MVAFTQSKQHIMSQTLNTSTALGVALKNSWRCSVYAEFMQHSEEGAQHERQWKRSSAPLVAHLRTHSTSIVVVPVVGTHRHPRLALWWVTLQQEVGPMEADCKSREDNTVNQRNHRYSMWKTEVSVLMSYSTEIHLLHVNNLGFRHTTGKRSNTPHHLHMTSQINTGSILQTHTVYYTWIFLS